MPKLRIGAKNLGLPLVKSYCPRRLWILASMSNKFPYWRPLPRIINHLDGLQKPSIQRYIDVHRRGPKWMGPFREVVEQLDIDWLLHTDQASGLRIRGRVDAVQRISDGTLQVIDYKTADRDTTIHTFLSTKRR